MIFTTYFGLFLLCLLQSIEISRSDWKNPPFTEPQLMDEVIRSFIFDANTGRTNIELEEEVDHEVCIAVVNYDGDGTPTVGSLEENKNNFVLGAELRLNTNGKWEVWITKKQDYETPIMQKYRIPIIFGAAQYTIALNIINIDDNPPVIMKADDRSCSIEENYAGKSNCTYIIRDADGFKEFGVPKITLTASPKDGVEHFKFVTSAVSGDKANYELNALLEVSESLDFESISMFSLSIQAVDQAGHEGSFSTVVEVIDMPDEPPMWTTLTAAENILEKTTKTFPVRAIDGDIQINATINYRIEPINDERDEQFFVVNKETGDVTIKPINRDELKKEIFRFLIVAYEVPEPESKINTTIIVIVEDVNDNIPEITPEVLKIEIEEEKYMTLEFEQGIAIADPDLAENGQFAVSLVDNSKYNWSSAFLVVPTSGYQHGIFTISVINASLLDYEDENWRVIDLQLRAIEKADASHIGTKTIHIELINWNDELPIFDKNTATEVAVKEDVEINSFIATMHATDRDVDDHVTHSLVAQRTLAIDKQSGNITTTQNDAFDYESMPVVVVQVVATDKAAHETFATLKINVIDVNDVPPKLYLPKQVPSLVEEEPLGTTVKTLINATDVDTDADLIFSIDWDNTKAHKGSIPVDEKLYRGHLDIRTDWPEDHKRYAEGTLFIADRIDYEKFDVMFLTISVTDRKTVHNENTTSASLTLNIVDINDNWPIFDTIEPMSVVENQVADALIAPVTAKDADGPMYNKVSYSIKPTNGTKDGLISINETTGAIKTNLYKAIDAEEYEYIYYDVTASDGENEKTEHIEIYVIDVNDEVPKLLTDKFNSTIYKREKSPNGTEIVRIYAKDDDRTSPYNNISYLINSEYSAAMQYFSMGRFDGLLVVNLKGDHILDRDAGPAEFTLNLKLRDNYLVDGVEFNSNAIDTTVKVILLDINDQIPELEDKGNPAATVSENSKKGALILSVLTNDKDDPATVNTKAFFKTLSIKSPDGIELGADCKELFIVDTKDEKTADIYANCDLRGYYGRWEVELYAQDLGVDPGPQNHTRTYVIQINDFNYYDPVIEFPTTKSISLRKEQTLHATLRTYDDQLLNDFNATDKDYGESGVVTFTLSSKTGDDAFFEMVSISKNVEQLRLAKPVDVDEKKTYKITLTATDGGNPPRSVNREVTLIFVSASGPEFTIHDWTVWIKENKTGLDYWGIIEPEAHDMISEAGENIVDIYYFFTNAHDVDMKHFALEKATRNLTVKEELDREKQDIMTLYVVATTNKDSPPGNPAAAAVLKITVVVLDENDNAPIFEEKSYSAGVATEDAVDKVVLTVKATDADLNDTLTYSIVPGSMTTSDSSLRQISQPFSIDPETGALLLKFSATSNMKGFFKFDMVVHDAVDHTDTTAVKIYVVEPKNRVVFTFNNSASYVTEQKMFIIESFNDAFGYTCNVDDIKTSVGEDNHVLDNVTTVRSHFINREDNPIGSDQIILTSSDLQTITNLKMTLLKRSLRLVDVPTGSSSVTGDMQQTVHWILVSLTIFFCLCSISLLIVFVFRTRRLTQRLDKLAITKYGSQESGLDRAGVVPTTNQFAIAGSNPMWNTKEKTIDDNVSQGSGDSDLIGVEDNPDFGYVNSAFASDDRWENARRGSVNPVLANHGPVSGGLFERISYPEEEKKKIFN